MCSLVDGDLEIKVVLLDASIGDSMVFEDAVPVPITPTTPTSNVTGGPDLSSLFIPIVVVGAASIVIIVIVIIIKKKN